MVAIKKLYSSNEVEFNREAHILRELGSQDPHLVTLLATYQLSGKFHLVFRKADTNLRKYWNDRPSPNFDEAIVLWVLKQMAGIAHGLYSIHNFQTSHPSYTNRYNVLGKQDIKAENILWFPKLPGIEDRMSVLQIADFGLGEFHRRYSLSKVYPSGVVSTLTYKPPECQLKKHVSRAYDIWSLGFSWARQRSMVHRQELTSS